MTLTGVNKSVVYCTDRTDSRCPCIQADRHSDSAMNSVHRVDTPDNTTLQQARTDHSHFRSIVRTISRRCTGKK